MTLDGRQKSTLQPLSSSPESQLFPINTLYQDKEDTVHENNQNFFKNHLDLEEIKY